MSYEQTLYSLWPPTGVGVIILLLLLGGDPRRTNSMSLEVAARLGSSIAFDLRSPTARMRFPNAAASTSRGVRVVGDVSLLLPVRLLGRPFIHKGRVE